MTRLSRPMAVLLQVAGMATVAVALGFIYLPAGLIAAGAALFATGFVIDLPRRR